MEQWSSAILKFCSTNPSLQQSITPLIHYSNTPLD